MKNYCPDSREHFSAYLDGELDSGKREKVENHLDACQTCREDLQKMTVQAGLLRQLAVLPVPTSDVDEAISRWRGQLDESQSLTLPRFLSHWRYQLAALTVGAILFAVFLLPQRGAFRYYSLDNEQVRLLERGLAASRPAESLIARSGHIIKTPIIAGRERSFRDSFVASIAYENNKDKPAFEAGAAETFRYYPLQEEQARFLEKEHPPDSLKYRLGVLLTGWRNQSESASLEIDRKMINEENLLSSIAREKVAVIEAGDLETYRFYTKVEIVILSVLNENQANSRLTAVMSGKYL